MYLCCMYWVCIYMWEKKSFLNFFVIIFSRILRHCGCCFFISKNAKCEKFPPLTFKFCYYFSIWMCMSSRFIWIKSSSCKCNFHPESFFSFLFHLTWNLCTQNFVGKAQQPEEKNPQKFICLLCCSSASSELCLIRHMPEELTQKKWQLLLLRFFFYNLSLSSRSSEFNHSIPSPRSRLFFRGWSCCLLCSWFLFLQICLMTIKNTNGKLLFCFLCCLCCCYTPSMETRREKKFYEWKYKEISTFELSRRMPFFI